MKIALMQPYFFPYVGYLQLIKSVDRFILFDDVQYIQRGWINRNRILKPVEGLQYVICPVAGHSSSTLIKDIQIVPDSKWKAKILRQVEHYHTAAPFYSQVHQVLRRSLEFDGLGIAGLNAHCLRLVCGYLGVDFKIEMSSDLGLDYSSISEPGDWGLHVSLQLGASEYINPVGGAAIFDPAQFEERGVRLTLLTPRLEHYDQRRQGFEPSLSILDVLMFNAPEDVNGMLESATLDTIA